MLWTAFLPHCTHLISGACAYIHFEIKCHSACELSLLWNQQISPSSGHAFIFCQNQNITSMCIWNTSILMITDTFWIMCLPTLLYGTALNQFSDNLPPYACGCLSTSSWQLKSLLYRDTLLLNWYEMSYMGYMSYQFIWDKSTKMFSMHLQFGVPRHFDWRITAVSTYIQPFCFHLLGYQCSEICDVFRAVAAREIYLTVLFY